MKNAQKPMVFFKGTDVVILAILLFCSVLAGWLPLRSKGTQAVIAMGGITLAVVDLEQEQSALQIAGAEGFVFCVADGAISVTEAPCEAKICCKSHRIDAAGQSIVCLPCQLTVLVTEAHTDSIPLPDAVIG